MSKQRVGFSPDEIATRKRMKDNNKGLAIVPGENRLLASLLLPCMGFPVLETLYYDASVSANVKFSVQMDGVNLPDDFASSSNPIGAPGNPTNVGKDLEPGRTVQIYCLNNGAANIDAYCDGEVYIYAQRPR